MKKILSLVLSLLLAAGMLPFGIVTASARENGSFAPITAEDYYGRALLNEKEQAVYDLIAACVESAQGKADIRNYQMKLADVQRVYAYYVADHPQHFWRSTSYGYSQFTSGVIASFNPMYDFTGDALAAARAAFEEKVDWVVSLVRGLSSDYDRALALHDWLCENVAYDLDAPNRYSAYGALVDGRAVCEGYAEAYQYLLYRAGIPCLVVTGTSLDESSGVWVGHEWNVLRIGGEWYHVDVTWDDQTPNTFHAYFCLTEGAVCEDHVIGQDNYPLPTCASTFANYAVKQGVRLSAPYDAAAVAAALRRGNGTARLFVDDAAAFTAWHNQNHGAVARACGIVGTYSYQITSLSKEIIIRYYADQVSYGGDPRPDADGFLIVDGVLRAYSGPGGAVTVPASVTEIGSSAFYGCKTLTGITIPASVKRIGAWAFASCTGLTSVSLPAGVEVGNHAFYACSRLTGVSLGERVTVGNDAFAFCTALTSVDPSGASAIGDYAFYACDSLVLRVGCADESMAALARQNELATELTHAFGAWIETTPATCTAGGEETRYCANCDEFETRPTDPNPKKHSFGAWIETTPATCTAGGEETRYCVNCDEFETRPTGPKGHSFGAWIETTPATCTAGGEETRYCANCDEFETRPTDPKGHSFINYVDNGDGTATAQCEHCEATNTISRELWIGDLDGDGEITDEDAIWLLMYTFFPEDYPITDAVACDFDGDGEITDEDAIWLLMYTFFPDDYPIV